MIKVPRLSYTIEAPDEYYNSKGYLFADTIFERKWPTHSKLLGLDGKPLPYEDPPKIGFDLSPKTRRTK